jgi:ABC-type uncharacterized transport system permease subunit
VAEHRSFRLTTTPSADSIGQPSLAARAKHSRAITVAVVQQGFVLILAALILDGGVTLRFCAAAAIASWVCALVIILRRPQQPTNFDLAIIRYGFGLALPLVLAIGFLVDRFVR